ncbi:MAG: BrxA/BrxB family bacilliredoxin [Gemmatimonadaceae bacterium]|nr:BrxA/BrxB family bacilliredoxin [Gemmatimonadaceae bacterium]
MKQLSLYDERLVTPMRHELTTLGFEELRSADEVDRSLKDASGTALVVVNSVCGCSARNARPAVALALGGDGPRPDRLFTVFAGQEVEATNQARSYFTGKAPSSPSIALLKDGALVHMIERREIEGRAPAEIAANLQSALERFC